MHRRCAVLNIERRAHFLGSAWKSYLSSVLPWREEKPSRNRLEVSMADLPVGCYRTELNRTVRKVPEKYKDLSPIGTGAYGQVW